MKFYLSRSVRIFQVEKIPTSLFRIHGVNHLFISDNYMFSVRISLLVQRYSGSRAEPRILDYQYSILVVLDYSSLS